MAKQTKGCAVMARYIDGERLRNHVALYMAENAYINDTALDVLKMVSEWINEAPTVDAEPVKHGRWAIDEEDIEWGNSLKKRYCTNCGKRPHYDKEKREFILSDYCPHCGAKMDEVQ